MTSRSRPLARRLKRAPESLFMPSANDPVTDVTEARAAYLAARDRVRQARLALGRAIAEARAQDVEQVTIARTLSLSREQVRRYQAEYEKSLTGEP